MIKNVIFDFGQVLVHFEPDYMTGRYIKDEADKNLAKDVIFDRLYWDRLDAGTIAEEEVIEGIKSRLPERLWESSISAYKNWIYNIPEVDKMADLIKYIKEEYGVKVYLLSNISQYFAEHSGEFEILKNMDGCVFSAVCGLVKPNREIFEHILEKFDLLPEETVFVDDNEGNIKGAAMVGIEGYLFKKDPDELKKWFDNKLK